MFPFGPGRSLPPPTAHQNNRGPTRRRKGPTIRSPLRGTTRAPPLRCHRRRRSSPGAPGAARFRTGAGAPRARNAGTTRPEDGRSPRNTDAPRARRIGTTRPGRETFRSGPGAPRAPHTGSRPGAGRARKRPGAPRARNTGSRPEGGMFRKNPGAPEAETTRGKAEQPLRGTDTTLPHRPLLLLLLALPKAKRPSGKRTGRGRTERRDMTRLLHGLPHPRGTAGGGTGAVTESPGRSGIPRGTGPAAGPEGGRGNRLLLLGDRGATGGGPRRPPPQPSPTASRRAETARLRPGGRGTAVRRRGA